MEYKKVYPGKAIKRGVYLGDSHLNRPGGRSWRPKGAISSLWYHILHPLSRRGVGLGAVHLVGAWARLQCDFTVHCHVLDWCVLSVDVLLHWDVICFAQYCCREFFVLLHCARCAWLTRGDGLQCCCTIFLCSIAVALQCSCLTAIKCILSSSLPRPRH